MNRAASALLLLSAAASAACGQGEHRKGAAKPVIVASPSASAMPSMTPPPRPFTDETRKAIFAEAAAVEARANQEAVAANPDADSVGGGTNPEKMVRRVQKR